MHSGGWNTWGSWLPGAPATPATDQYVFVHTGDGYDSPQSLSVFTGIGVLGAGKSVDNAAPPYDDAHILTTSVSSATRTSPPSPTTTRPSRAASGCSIGVAVFVWGAVAGDAGSDDALAARITSHSKR
jgi:hypothetical protein